VPAKELERSIVVGTLQRGLVLLKVHISAVHSIANAGVATSLVSGAAPALMLLQLQFSSCGCAAESDPACTPPAGSMKPLNHAFSGYATTIFEVCYCQPVTAGLRQQPVAEGWLLPAAEKQQQSTFNYR
jgi:hypothetical protein